MPKRSKEVPFMVKKVPLDYYPPRYQANFQSMPILYLELLENKQKVKKELRNKEYEPPVDRVEMASVSVPTTYQAEAEPVTETDKDFEVKEYEDESTTTKKVRGKNIKILDLTEPTDTPQKEYVEEPKRKDEGESERRGSDAELEEKRKYEEDDYKKVEPRIENRELDEDREVRSRLEQRFSKLKQEYKSRSNRESDKDNTYSRTSSRSDKYESIQNKLTELREVTKEEFQETNLPIENSDNDVSSEVKNEEAKNEEDTSSETQKKLMDMFSQDKSSPQLITSSISSNVSFQKSESFIPPTLSQINNGVVRDNKGVRDMSKGISKQEEEDEVQKREYLDKFAILKRKYKEFKVPEFSPYTDIGTMKRTYESALKQLNLDSSVETYKKYLIGGFMATQWVVNKFLKIDMTGFAEQQILSMNQYDTLLVELGEKQRFQVPSQLPVELKLLLLVGFNAIIFIVSKMFLKSSGDNILGSINKMAEKAKPATPQAPKPHMKGPSMDDLADIENLVKKSKKD